MLLEEGLKIPNLRQEIYYYSGTDRNKNLLNSRKSGKWLIPTMIPCRRERERERKREREKKRKEEMQWLLLTGGMISI